MTSRSTATDSQAKTGTSSFAATAAGPKAASATTAGPKAASAPPNAARGRSWDSPVTSYYVLLGASLVLLAVGLVMVLSASAVTSLKNSGSSFTVFADQLVFALVGIPLMLLAARISVTWWQRLAWPSLGLALLGQLLVFTPLGVSVQGNRNWIELGSHRVQPSEGLKFALVLWGAMILARKQPLLNRWPHVVIPVLFPVGALAVGLVLAGKDLGTSIILLAIVGGLLFVSGVPLRLFLGAGAAMAALVATFVATSPNRSMRIAGWLAGGCAEADAATRASTCYQPIHGRYALADGGLWGVGLGASRQKWSWLPEAHNDFIFAIIGEELGLPGALTVLGLYLLIAWVCLRLITRNDSAFIRCAAAGAMTWLIGQMLINVGAVLGLLPVIGLPLPLVSSGGSALVAAMLTLGMLLAFARAEPGAALALRSRSRPVRRILRPVLRPLRAQRSRLFAPTSSAKDSS